MNTAFLLFVAVAATLALALVIAGEVAYMAMAPILEAEFKVTCEIGSSVWDSRRDPWLKRNDSDL